MPRHGPAIRQLPTPFVNSLRLRFDVIGPGEPDPDHFVCSPESGESGG